MKSFLFVLLPLLCLTTPTPPQWPDTFHANFTESLIYPILGSHDTTGTYYYSWSQKLYRVDRDNGRFDRYCGVNGLKLFYNTPCTQYVANGDRFMYYPNHDECCYCCSEEHGCGLLKPDWLGDAKYVEQGTHNGIDTFK